MSEKSESKGPFEAVIDPTHDLFMRGRHPKAMDAAN